MRHWKSWWGCWGKLGKVNSYPHCLSDPGSQRQWKTFTDFLLAPSPSRSQQVTSKRQQVVCRTDFLPVSAGGAPGGDSVQPISCCCYLSLTLSGAAQQWQQTIILGKWQVGLTPCWLILPAEAGRESVLLITCQQ